MSFLEARGEFFFPSWVNILLGLIYIFSYMAQRSAQVNFSPTAFTVHYTRAYVGVCVCSYLLRMVFVYVDYCRSPTVTWTRITTTTRGKITTATTVTSTVWLFLLLMHICAQICVHFNCKSPWSVAYSKAQTTRQLTTSVALKIQFTTSTGVNRMSEYTSEFA